jgi:hypothetical protein
MTSCDPAPIPCFDPRDPSQSVDDSATWRPTDSAVLITATMLLTGPDEGLHSVSWEKVAALADLCDAAADAVEDAPRVVALPADTNATLQAVLARRANRETTNFQADDFGTST